MGYHPFRIYNQGRQFYVTDYGAKGDGKRDDTVAIQRAVDAAQVISGGQLARAGPVIFPLGQYKVTAPITIPVYAGGIYGVPFLFSGYGAEILSTHAGSVFKRELPTSTAQANNAAVVAPIFEGFKLVGPGVSGSRAIDLVATYGATVHDCLVSNFDIGIALAFGLKSRLENVFVQRCTTYGIAITSAFGLWGDATTGNSASNSSEAVSCRITAKAGQAAAFYLRDADNLRLIECIAEGENPVNNVDYSATGRFTFVVDNMHFENTPTGAHIRAVVRGRAVIRNPVFYSTNTVVIDGTGTNNAATIVVDGLTYLDTGNQFKHGVAETYAWDFRGVGDNETFDVTAAARWVGGVVPTRLRTLFQGASIGINDQTIRKRKRGANSIADGGTIAHGLGATPVIAKVQASVAGEFASVTGLDSTNITVAIKTHAGAGGTTQTVYWDAET